jgi:ribosomal-protein-alanine N-acetyltransferase
VDKASGEVIGYCGFRINEGRTELHYLLARAYWCAGLATEAARAALRYAFEELRLTEIIALVRPENTASARVLKKIGMRHTGRQERFFGHNFDRYLITMSDYQADNAPYSFRLTSVA